MDLRNEMRRGTRGVEHSPDNFIPALGEIGGNMI